MEKLHAVNEKLKKYVHVNKKALDQVCACQFMRGVVLVRLTNGILRAVQYVSFQEQKRDLETRLAEVMTGQEVRAA